MPTFRHILAGGMAATALAACLAARPTQVTTTFRSRAASPAQFRKILAVFPGEDAALRRRVEDKLAQNIANTVPSYRIIPDAELADTQRVITYLTEGGFDGVVVLRLVSVEQRSGGDTTRVSDVASEDLVQYLRRAPRAALRPGRETVITMESRLYSFRDRKLVWGATSETFNPLSMGELIGHLVDASVEELRKQRLI